MHASNSSLNAVQKACQILTELANPGPHRLSNIVADTGFNKATTLRLLDMLTSSGFVVRDAFDKSYSLGNEAYVMGAAVARRTPLPDCALASLVKIAELSGDAACLCIPCGNDSVCIERHEGANAVQANYMHVGRRLPLGIGAAGLALLAWLPEEEIDAVTARNISAIARFPRLDVRRIRRAAEEARTRGYAMSANIVCIGTGGIGVPILDVEGRPIAAIGVTALARRLISQEKMLADLLLEEAALIERRLRQHTAARAPLRHKSTQTGQAAHVGG
ncbi:MAG: transcriptional regulator, IclR family [Rhodoferax sp.]|nr:transcriptional regulator, IclR family [Rhodoferax sp.]